MKYKKQIMCLLLLLSFSLPLWARSDGENDDINGIKDELDKIQTKLFRNRKAITTKQREKSAVQNEVSTLTKQLWLTELQLQNARKRLQVTRNRIDVNHRNISELEKRYDNKKDQFRRRIIEIYKNKNKNLMTVLFSSRDTASPVDMLYYFERLMKSDISLIQELKEEHSKLKQEKLKLHNQTEQLMSLKEEIYQKEQNLSVQKEEKARKIQTLSVEIAEMERQNRDLEQSSMEITSFIKRQRVDRVGALGTGSFIKPTMGWISSGFGYRRHPLFRRVIMHNGIDIAAPKGTKIYAADSGIIIVAGAKPQYRGYGNIVIIDHGCRRGDTKSYSTVYAHQSKILVQEGDIVTKGDVIGLVGSTGYSTGPHLHFEVREDGIPVNPVNFINQ